MSSAATEEMEVAIMDMTVDGKDSNFINSEHGHNETSGKSKGRKRTRLEKILAVIVVLLLVVIVVLVIIFFQHIGTASDNTKSSGQSASICNTPACTKTASRVISAIDPDVDPCDNFYEFACGGWMKTMEIPDDKPNIVSYGLLREHVTKTLKKTLEKPVSEGDIECVVNVKKLYQSCINEDLIEQENLTSMYRLLEELGGWPLLGDAEGGRWSESRFDMTRLLLGLLKYNNQPVVPLWVGIDDRNNTRRIVVVDQQWFGMPNRDYYLEPFLDMFKSAYRKLMFNVSVMLGADRQTVDQDVDDMLALETDLARICVGENERRSSSQYYNKMTVRDLNNMTDTAQADRLQFDWLSFINGALQLPNEKYNVTDEEEVIVQSIAYYEQLWGVLAKYPKRTIANYIVWRITKNRAVNLPRRFRDEVDAYTQTLYGNRASPPRWHVCVNYIKVTFEMVLGRMFVLSSFDNSSKAEAVDMIHHVRSSFKELVDGLDWMDGNMKEVAKEKADSIVELVGYPDYILDDEQLNSVYDDMPMNETTYFHNVLRVLERDARDALHYLREPNFSNTSRFSWSTSPPTVNAFYSFQRNQISFPAGILQPPYFSVDQPRSLNYGGIGFMMGHEITHGFDDQGREYDKDGNLLDWWSPEAALSFKEKAQCIIDQYSEFVSPEAGVNLDGVKTQGENIADNGAVKQAYMMARNGLRDEMITHRNSKSCLFDPQEHVKAYRKWVEEQGSEEPLLPGLDYTHDQLFFMNLAQIRCGLSRPEDALSHIQTGRHSPNRFRVLGSLMNFDQFSKVFNCPVNSYMNPEKKCSVW